MSNKTKIFTIACIVMGFMAIIVGLLFFNNNKVYTVSFDTDGGSNIAIQEIKKGEQVVQPSNPVKDNYTFDKWEYQNKVYDFTTPVESDLTLKAIWKKNEEPVKKYQITIKVDGKEKTIEVSNINEINLEKLGFEEKSGYALKWYVNGEEYDFTNPLTDDILVEGKYEKTSSYTVKFNSNGGSTVKSQTVTANSKAVEPTNIEKEGYIFEGWYLNNKLYDFNSSINKNITLVAKWSEDPTVKRYTVSFNSDGGSSVASQKIIENKTATQPSNPTKNGYAFLGWYLDDNKYNFSSKVTKNITLVAKWNELTSYIVTFDSNGGSDVATQTVAKGGKVTKPTNPTRDGYTFEGWKLNGNVYVFSNEVNSDLTLMAIWTKLTSYTVVFNSNGGSDVANQTVAKGGKVTKPTNPTKSGYTFKEWQLDGSAYDFSSTVNANITLVATWNQKNYTITSESAGFASTDRLLKVYENGAQISVKEIRYTDGVLLTKNMYVEASDIAHDRFYTVVLNSGTQVRAELVS